MMTGMQANTGTSTAAQLAGRASSAVSVHVWLCPQKYLSVSFLRQRGSSVQQSRPEATFLHSALCVASLSPQVSAFVRAMLYDPEMRLNGGSVIAYDPCATAASEASLLTSVLDLYACGALPAGLQDIGEDMVRQQQEGGPAHRPQLCTRRLCSAHAGQGMTRACRQCVVWVRRGLL